MRGLSLLRMLLLDYEMQVWRGKVGDLAAYADASRTINQYFDEELRFAISVYGSAEQPSPLSAD